MYPAAVRTEPRARSLAGPLDLCTCAEDTVSTGAVCRDGLRIDGVRNRAVVRRIYGRAQAHSLRATRRIVPVGAMSTQIPHIVPRRCPTDRVSSAVHGVSHQMPDEREQYPKNRLPRYLYTLAVALLQAPIGVLLGCPELALA